MDLQIFSHMAWELETKRLTVVLTPAAEQRHVGHMVRTVQASNPEWYKRLCSQYQSNRKARKGRFNKHGDTKVKRRHILYLLKRLAAGKVVDSKYKEFIVAVASNMHEKFETEYARLEVPF